MIRISNLNMPLEMTTETLKAACARLLRQPETAIQVVKLRKKSIDARDKSDVHFVVTADVSLSNEKNIRKLPKNAEFATEKPSPVYPVLSLSCHPVVVGAGPAGLFCALTLARCGLRPILIERGKAVDERSGDVELLKKQGKLDTESNVLFGEGGAGAFSDGKLNTGIKSPHIRTVLETMIDCGAPEEIGYMQKPHIGTDLLCGVVKNIRQEIIRLGGEVRFETKLTSLILKDNVIHGVHVLHHGVETEIPTEFVFLCLGHSARDTVEMLYQQGVAMEQKPFAMGVRVEHPQKLIDRSQYGKSAGHPALGAASYKLAAHTKDGRGCYTFCMCPGGEVICSASEEGRLSVNGMSYHARSGENANSALLVGIRPEDFGDEHPLSGIRLQRLIEEKAFIAGGRNMYAPVQRAEDFLSDRPSSRIGDVTPTYQPGVTPCDLRDVLPAFMVEDLKTGIRAMAGQLKGFDHPDAILTGAETRSSSPVRLVRGEDFVSRSIRGVYPVGEGAGYAGGIVSAAVDGVNAALAIVR